MVPLAQFTASCQKLESPKLRLVQFRREHSFELLRPNVEIGEFSGRLRSRGLSSLRRHADPTQARGYKDALVAAFEADPKLGVTDEACALHKLVFAKYPNLAGRIRQREDEARIASFWLDGRPAHFHLLSTANVESQLGELDAGFASLEGVLHPALMTAAIIWDFTLVHPFLDGNGRTSRLLGLQLLARHGYEAMPLINIERRLDRERAKFETIIGASRRRDSPEEFLFYWVDFLAKSAQDAVTRAERSLVASTSIG